MVNAIAYPHIMKEDGKPARLEGRGWRAALEVNFPFWQLYGLRCLVGLQALQNGTSPCLRKCANPRQARRLCWAFCSLPSKCLQRN